ncbi:MAG: hypothetical protein ABJE95_01450 [Byssovorax sp.]
MTGESTASKDRSEARQTRQEIRLFAVVVAAVLGSRLPFIAHGYGTDPDTWRVAEAARRIASTHDYVPSRLPGNPVQEIVCALIRGGGPPALNGATAVMSALAAGFFALSLRRLGRPEAAIAALALAFTPVVYVSSVAAMDYLWALAFLLAGLYSLLTRRVVLGGVLVGLAVGCRLTSCLFVGPLSLYLLLQDGEPMKARIARAVKVCAVAAGIGLACYIPILRQLGLAALKHEANHPGLVEALKAATLDTWGLIGVLALAAAAAAVVVNRGRDPAAPSLRQLAPWLAAIGLYLALFALLPNEAGYLIPIVPFVLLVLGWLLPRRQFLRLAIALAASSFFFGIGRAATPGGPVASTLAMPFTVHGKQLVLDPLQGPVLAADSARHEAERYVARVIARGGALRGNNVIVAGYWWTQVHATLSGDAPPREEYVEFLGPDRIELYTARGDSIYYLARQDAYNVYQGGIDLPSIQARELEIEEDAKETADR